MRYHSRIHHSRNWSKLINYLTNLTYKPNFFFFKLQFLFVVFNSASVNCGILCKVKLFSWSPMLIADSLHCVCQKILPNVQPEPSLGAVWSHFVLSCHWLPGKRGQWKKSKIILPKATAFSYQEIVIWNNVMFLVLFFPWQSKFTWNN